MSDSGHSSLLHSTDSYNPFEDEEAPRVTESRSHSNLPRPKPTPPARPFSTSMDAIPTVSPSRPPVPAKPPQLRAPSVDPDSSSNEFSPSSSATMPPARPPPYNPPPYTPPAYTPPSPAYTPETPPNYSPPSSLSSSGEYTDEEKEIKKDKKFGTMKGALKSMKSAGELVRQRAVETKKKVEESKFVEQAKGKAANAMEKTKEVAHKASEQTKIVAHKAADQTKVVAHKASEQTKIVAQKAKEKASTLKEKMNKEDEVAEANTSGASPSLSSSGYIEQRGPPGQYTIFGVPLKEAVEKSAKINEDIPDIVTKCVLYLQERGVREEGIFRLSGSSTHIKELRDAFDRGEEVDITAVKDEHVVTGLLKLYFRELPEPLFTRSLGGELRNIEKVEVEEQVRQLSSLMNELPKSNRAVLEQLLHLLNEITKNESVTKMNVVNLAIVFSPTLNCPMETMKVLIGHFSEIFNYSLIEL